MKRSTIFTLILVTTVSVFVWSNGYAQTQNVDWEIFSKNLVNALQSENEGLQQSAMQLVIKYDSRLDVKDAVFDVMQVFRNHKNQKVRQLALITLTNMNSKWAMGFLKRQIQFEGNPEIRHQLVAINYASFEKKTAPEENLTISQKDFNNLQEQLLAISK